jgi:phosphatidylserine decarboxylase
MKRDLGLALQYGLPHRFLSRCMYYLMRSEIRPLKNLLIKQIAKRFKVDMQDALEPELTAYPSFNAFFTRALKPNAGPIVEGRILQAKGMDYTAAELLGDAALAEKFAAGSFATIYLSPRDYHRLHMPYGGDLQRTLHVPGRLFSVATWTAESIPRLFARNERLVCVFDTDQGLMAVVLVGAIFVSSIETVWSGTVTPPYAPRIIDNLQPPATHLDKGLEMGRFNMGSTAIVLTEKPLQFKDSSQAGKPIKMGQVLGHF